MTKPSAEYFHRTRKEMLGKHLDEIEKDQNVDQCWKKAEEAAQPVGELLRKHGGPYFLGKTGTFCRDLKTTPSSKLIQVQCRMRILYLSPSCTARDAAVRTCFSVMWPWIQRSRPSTMRVLNG